MLPGPSHPGTGARIAAHTALAATALLCALLQPGPAAGAGEAGASADTSGSAVAPPARPAFLTRPAERLTPLARAMRERLEAGDRELAGLEARLATTREPAAILGLFRRIHEAKRRTEHDLLRVQLEFARAEGRAEDATRLAAALDSLATPRVVAYPAERPAPASVREEARP